MHAIANIPAECPSACIARFLGHRSLPENSVGSASASPFSRPAQRSLTLRPAYSPSHPKVTLCTEGFSCLSFCYCSDCHRLERQLPGGVCTHWDAVPFHGAREMQASPPLPAPLCNPPSIVLACTERKSSSRCRDVGLQRLARPQQEPAPFRQVPEASRTITETRSAHLDHATIGAAGRFRAQDRISAEDTGFQPES